MKEINSCIWYFYGNTYACWLQHPIQLLYIYMNINLNSNTVLRTQMRNLILNSLQVVVNVNIKATFNQGHTVFTESVFKEVTFKPLIKSSTQELLCLKQSLKLRDYKSFRLPFLHAHTQTEFHCCLGICLLQGSFKDLLCYFMPCCVSTLIAVTDASLSLFLLLSLQPLQS